MKIAHLAALTAGFLWLASTHAQALSCVYQVCPGLEVQVCLDPSAKEAEIVDLANPCFYEGIGRARTKRSGAVRIRAAGLQPGNEECRGNVVSVITTLDPNTFECTNTVLSFDGSSERIPDGPCGCN